MQFYPNGHFDHLDKILYFSPIIRLFMDFNFDYTN
jgi:hypothetical protein